MAIRDALASRYPDLDPGTLDRLSAMGGDPMEAPIDPGTAAAPGTYVRAAGGDPVIGPTRADMPPPTGDMSDWEAAGARAPGSPGYGGAQKPLGAPETFSRAYKGSNAAPQGTKEAYEQELLYASPDVAAKRAGYTPGEQQIGPPRELAPGGGPRGINPTADAPSVAGGGGSTIRAGWMPASRQMQVQQGYSMDELEPMHTAQGMRQNEARDRMESELVMANKHGAADAAYANAYAEQARVYQGRIAFEQEQRNRMVDEEMRKLNELSVQTQKEIDPSSGLGAGGDILAALFVGLGQFGAALTGGQNAALQIMQAGIDRRIRAQEANIDKAGKAFAHRENLLARNLEAFGDREKAIQATRINYLDFVGAELQAKIADESLPLQQRQRAHAMLEKVYEDRAKVEETFMKYAHNQVQMAQNDRFAITGGGGGAAAGKQLENTVQLPDGTVVQLDNSAQANEVSKTLGYHAQTQAIDKRALQLREELKKLDPATDRVKYQSTLRELEMAGKDRMELSSQARGQGVITKEDAKREESTGLNYTQGFGSNAITGTIRKHLDPTNKGDLTIGDNGIRSSIERSNVQSRALVEAHRGRIVKGDYVKDPTTGQLRPRDLYTGQDPKPKEQRAPNDVKAKDPDVLLRPRGESLEEATPKKPVVQGPAGGASGSNINYVPTGGSGGKGKGGRKRK